MDPAVLTEELRVRKRIAFFVAGSTLMSATPALAQGVIENTGSGDAIVIPLGETTPAIYPGQDSWIALPWTVENAEAREFQVTSVASDGIEIGYPENTGSFTSLSRDDTLSVFEIDYTALRVRVDPLAPAPQVLTITLSFVSDSGPLTQTIELPVTIDDTPFVGQGLLMGEGRLGTLASTDTAWFSIGLEGLVDSSRVELRVLDGGPFSVVYPSERNHSRPNLGLNLAANDRDNAAIRFSSEGVEPGEYTVVVEASYFVGVTRVTTLVERVLVVEDGEESGGSTGVVYDSAANPGGWIVNPDGTDTATTGQWDISVPEAASWNGNQTQLGYTPSGAPGVITTGARGSGTGANDVDGGVTSALSPRITLPAGDAAEMTLSYYFAHLHNATKADYFRISIVGESGTETILYKKGKASIKEAKWKTRTFDLSGYSGQDIYILVEAADEGSGSLVEAALADILIRTQVQP